MTQRTDHLAPVSRRAQLVLGSVLAFLALVLTGLGLLGVWVEVHHHEPNSLVIGASSLIIGLGLGWLAFRLLAGRGRRRDGGLFSPSALRICGTVFYLEPAAQLLMRSWGILWAATSIAAGTACFALARKRSRPPGELPEVEPFRPR